MLDRLNVLLDPPDHSLQRQIDERRLQIKGEPPFDLLDLVLALWAVLDFYSSNSPLMLLVVILQYPMRRSRLLASAAIEVLASAEVEVVPLDDISAYILPAAAEVVLERKSPAARIPAQPSSADAAQVMQERPRLPERIPQETKLLDVLASAHHCAITGQTDAGKTTLLREVIARAVATGAEVVVLDPHAAPNKWVGCRVVGGGRNYAAIGVELADVMETMNSRYDDINSGKATEGDHRMLVVVSDEWISIMNNVKEAKQTLLAIITEGRKVRIKMSMAGHSRFLSGLGLDDSDQRASLAICVLYKSHGQRIAKLNGREYQVPMLTGTESVVEPVPESVLGPEPVPESVPELTDDELIVKLNGLGLSRNRIAAALGGNKEARMNQIRKTLGGAI